MRFMPIRTFRALLFLACLLCLFDSPAVCAKKMYRWVDEQGETYFSDQVPPEQAQHSHASLSKTGRVLELTEQAKTSNWSRKNAWRNSANNRKN
jgi:hypothetical protein